MPRMTTSGAGDSALANPFAPPRAEDPQVPQPQHQPFQSLLALATTLRFVMWAFVAAQLAVLVNALVTIGLAGQLDQADEEIGSELVAAVTERTELVDLLGSLMGLPAMVLFCLIYPRAVRNVRSFGLDGLDLGPIWSAVIFFVPIFSLWKPYYVTREIWRASTVPPDPRVSWKYTPAPALLPLWWWAYLLATSGSNLLGRIASGSSTTTVALLAIVSALWSIAAALLAARMITRLAALQQERHRVALAAVPA